MRKYCLRCQQIVYILLMIAFLPTCLLLSSAVEEDNKYYLGSSMKTEMDNGFADHSAIDSEDPHWGWKLGEFYLTDYTRQTVDANGNLVFLKNVGNTVTLWFDLQQDITKLNGNEDLSICEDTNGYDEYFGVPKTNFGKGTLIIRHTDYQNRVHDPVIYTDYLSAQIAEDAAVEVQVFEEGDYEVALNYEIIKHNWNIFGWDPIPDYYSYRIYFRFSVRNGNCMVYPKDVTTGSELSDSSITENGFCLDLVNSRYLDIDIKRSVRTEGAEGLTEDARFNKPATDGEKFTDEGIYTITVHNRYTGQTTEKIIYVGTDDVLKAHVVTGTPIKEIEDQLAMGATVTADGTILLPPVETTKPAEMQVVGVNDESNDHTSVCLFVAGGVLLIAVTAAVFTLLNKKAVRISAKNGEIAQEEPTEDGGSKK